VLENVADETERMKDDVLDEVRRFGDDLRDLQRVAMRMGCMASWSHESLPRRPPPEDCGCHRARHAQGRSGPYLRARNLHRRALRYQGPKRRAPAAGQGSRQKRPKIDERVSKLLEEDLQERPFATLKERCD
jgi:hypothetical protein